MTLLLRRLRAIVIAVIAFGVVYAAYRYLHTVNVEVLNPKGLIARREVHLIVIVCLLMLIIVIPVFVLTFGIAWRYREGNQKATYTPDWDHSRVFETIWWLVPSALIAVLAVITWNYTHELDPYKPIASSTPAINVQAVALDWKWLFIYPQLGIASVNYLQFPVGTPVNFQITSEGPMNSFWIPQLGGQIYAMAGMSSQLHLLADQTGDFRGSSANLSGEGFAKMNFVARASSQLSFDQWVSTVKNSPSDLTPAAYTALAKPSIGNPVTSYGATADNLYNQIVMKYMMPMPALGTTASADSPMSDMGMSGMDMK